ncbi:DUF1659 domain-containing protein [Clostridium sp. MB40-C1]|uniref:DUF1659 domain-containing protein n=1 Tax=Clostridium sp. MB40-C1 TaxID=3070996 RepID=UPI0027E1974D|nr:DUF1659 domain-containing protein [Clostridium sp. MB40-C1]WMJ81475.1 DUF1659 domain-containing protein [Clostridium sp. MB40-C1]
MAKSTNIKSSLFLKYHLGQDDKGKEVYKTQTFNNVRTAAADEDIYSVGMALGSLLPDPIVEIFRKNVHLLTEN